ASPRCPRPPRRRLIQPPPPPRPLIQPPARLTQPPPLIQPPPRTIPRRLTHAPALASGEDANKAVPESVASIAAPDHLPILFRNKRRFTPSEDGASSFGSSLCIGQGALRIRLPLFRSTSKNASRQSATRRHFFRPSVKDSTGTKTPFRPSFPRHYRRPSAIPYRSERRQSRTDTRTSVPLCRSLRRNAC